MKTASTVIFIAIGVGLIWYVLDHQVSQADVLGAATNGQLAGQLISNVASAIGEQYARSYTGPDADGQYNVDYSGF